MNRNYLDVLTEVIRNNWNKPALTDCGLLYGEAGYEYTYGSMYQEILRVCHLFEKQRLLPGDHIAICGANSSHWAISYLAIAAYKGVSVLLMHTLPTDSMASTIDYSDAKLLLVDNEIWKDLQNEPLPQVRSVISLDDFSVIKGQTPIAAFKPEQFVEVTFPCFEPQDLATICFTSGTTGEPKGAMLSYGAISNATLCGQDALPVCDNDNFVAMLPLAHVFGLVSCIMAQLEWGKHIFMLRSMAPSVMLNVMQQVRPYVVITVPMVIEHVYAAMGDAILSAFGGRAQEIIVGGAKFNPDLEEKLHGIDFPMVLLYGSTEGLVLAGSRLECYRRHSSGRVPRGMEACLSEQGEILYRGLNLMSGYYKNARLSAEKIDDAGWLHTGDVGHIDKEHNVFVEGRLASDMVVLPSGENVHLENIEQVINRQPNVAESIVVVRDGMLFALVVLVHETIDTKAAQNELMKAVNPVLPPYAQIVGVEFLTESLARTEKKTIKRYLYK